MMAVFKLLSRFALYQVMGEGAEVVMRFLGDRLSDESKLLVHALETANEKAWKSMEVALAGEGFWNKFDRAEDKAFRQQIKTLLDAMPLPLLTGRNEFRRKCLEELQTARKKGLLLSGSAQDVAQSPGSFLGHADQTSLVDRERSTLKEMGTELEKAGYRNLSWLISQEVQPGQALLVLSVKFYFRREVENNPELAASIQFTRTENLTENQAEGFRQLDDALQTHGRRIEEVLAGLATVVTEARDAAVEARDASARTHEAALDIHAEQKRHGGQLGEIYQMLQLLMDQTQMQQRREVRPGDSRSLRGPGERQRVRTLVDQYRALPEQERRQRPALLNAVGMLQVAAGETQEAQRDFDQLADLVRNDPKASAQARFNAYQAAIERRDFSTALAALREAAALDPEQYSPFPFSDYGPQRILGAGGFGVAFLCEHATLRCPVVVKTLRLDGLERNVDDVFREAQVLNFLDHSAIIRLRDCRFADSARTRPYLVMDYFESVSLGDHVSREGPLAPEDLLPVARSVAEALRAAHAKMIYHRDVKPDNLLVRHEDDRWRVKLIDFGLALKQEVAESTLRTPMQQAPTPRDYEVAGTYEYAAPEQMGKLQGAPVGPYSDVYGFGRTCYFALLGTPEPDDGEKETLPDEWRRLLSQCTARKVESRIQDFSAVLDRLKDLEGSLVGTAPPSRSPRPHRPTTRPPSAEQPRHIEPPREPALELTPAPPPPILGPALAEPASPPGSPPSRPVVGRGIVPPRYTKTETLPTEPTPQTSKPMIGGLFGATPPPADALTEDIEELPVLGEADLLSPPGQPKTGKSGPLGSLFTQAGVTPPEEVPEAEPVPEEKPPPNPPGKGKRGPLGGAFS
jgi:serine/threonine protein kinase